tara:strand:+ start:364 stop:894 length:531 start_codon:yes stop_codon:yes gene_type:complete
MIVIGIDPGKGGGISIINNAIIKEIYKCPITIKEMAEILKPYKLTWDYKVPIVAYIEQVHAFPTDGRSSAFKFGVNYGIWQGLLGAFNIETKFVVPQVWMKPLGLPKDKKERKQKIKSLAQNVIDKQKSFKNKKVTLYTSDAILISMYGYLKETVESMSLNKKIEVYKIFKERESK